MTRDAWFRVGRDLRDGSVHAVDVGVVVGPVEVSGFLVDPPRWLGRLAERFDR